jgi:signal transduction histidine kinase
MYDSARVYLGEAMEMKGGKELSGGRILMNFANSFLFEERYAEALKYYYEAMSYARLEKDKSLRGVFEARTAGNIAECYYLIGNQTQALYYGKMSDSILMKTNNPFSYVRPQALYIIASVHLDNQEYKEAEETMQEMLHVLDTIYSRVGVKNTGILWYIAYRQEGMSKIRLAQGDFQQAEDYAFQSIKTAEMHEDPAVTAKCWVTLSSVYLRQKEYECCREAALKAICLTPVAIKVNPALAYNIGISNMYLGDREGAEEYLRIYSEQMKKNTDRNFRETIAGMEVLYETEKKQLRIDTLEKERWYYTCLFVLSCLTAFSIVLIWRQYVKRQQQEILLVEARANTVGIMEGETKERERIAAELHDGVQGLLTAVKLNLNDGETALELVNKTIEEVRNISGRLTSKTLKQFGLRVTIEDYCLMFPNVAFRFFGVESRIPEHIEALLYRCAQELITNSIKYAEAENINVQLLQEAEHLSLTVFDDGKGFDIATSAKGLGLNSIYHRIDAINGKIDLFSSPEKGTETTIEINI